MLSESQARHPVRRTVCVLSFLAHPASQIAKSTKAAPVCAESGLYGMMPTSLTSWTLQEVGVRIGISQRTVDAFRTYRGSVTIILPIAFCGKSLLRRSFPGCRHSYPVPKDRSRKGKKNLGCTNAGNVLSLSMVSRYQKRIPSARSGQAPGRCWAALISTSRCHGWTMTSCPVTAWGSHQSSYGSGWRQRGTSSADSSRGQNWPATLPSNVGLQTFVRLQPASG